MFHAVYFEDALRDCFIPAYVGKKESFKHFSWFWFSSDTKLHDSAKTEHFCNLANVTGPNGFKT